MNDLGLLGPVGTALQVIDLGLEFIDVVNSVQKQRLCPSWTRWGPLSEECRIAGSASLAVASQLPRDS